MENNLKIDIQTKLESLKSSASKIQNLSESNNLKDEFLKK